MKKAVVCDLDGTFFHNEQWDGSMETFYKTLDTCYPVEWCQMVLQGLAMQGVHVLFVTARDEMCKHLTTLQLRKYCDFSWDLYMRSDGDLRDDYEVKLDILENLSKQYELLCCIDDNPSNCAFLKKFVPTLQVIL